MKYWILRIIGMMIFLGGLFFGGTIRSRQYCFGDKVFSSLGLPLWSNGTTGTHYPAIVGIIFILIGALLVTITLNRKYRIIFWVIALVILVLFCLYLL